MRWSGKGKKSPKILLFFEGGANVSRAIGPDPNLNVEFTGLLLFPEATFA